MSHERLESSRELGPATGACAWSAARRARASCSTASPVLLLCSNNYLGLADHPRVREAAADAAMRWGVGAGRLAPGLGHDDGPPPPRGARWPRSRAPRPRCCSARATWPTSASSARWPARGRGRLLRRAQPRLDHRRLPPRRAPRRSSTATATSSTSPGALRAGRRARRADRHRLRLLDGRRRRAARPRSSSSPAATACALVVDEAHGTGCLGPGGRGAVAEAGPRAARSTSSSARSARRSAPTAPTPRATQRCAQLPRQHARARSSSPPPRRRPPSPRALAALELLAEQPRRVERLQANADVAARRAGPRGLRGRRLDDADRAAGRRRRRRWRCASASWRSSAASSPRRSGRRPCPTGTSRLRLAVMATHTQGRAARGRARRSGAPRCRPGFRPGDGVPRRRRRARPPRRCGVERAQRPPLSVACTGSSSPAPTPASARPSSPRRSPPRCAPRGERGRARSSRSSPGSTSPSRDCPPDHELLAAAAGRRRPRTSRRCASGPPVSPHLAAELAGAELDPDALLAAARAAAHDARRRSSPRASAACSCRSTPRLRRARPRRATSACRSSSPRGPGWGRSTTRC